MIIAKRTCAHRKNLEKELKHLQIPYRVCFVENCADLVGPAFGFVAMVHHMIFPADGPRRLWGKRWIA